MSHSIHGLTFNVVRDVQAPALGSEGAAGIDFYIPAYNKKNAVDIFVMNYLAYKQDFVTYVSVHFNYDRNQFVPELQKVEDLVTRVNAGTYQLTEDDYTFIFDYLDKSAVYRDEMNSTNAPYIELFPSQSLTIPSGVYAKFPKGMALLALNRGGVATKDKIVRGACLTDSDYQGEIFLQLYTYDQSGDSKKISFGKKEIQLIYIPYVSEFSVEMNTPLDKFYLEKTSRGNGCLGSTDKK